MHNLYSQVRVPSFDLAEALENDHRARMEAEEAGEDLEDGELEFEGSEGEDEDEDEVKVEREGEGEGKNEGSSVEALAPTHRSSSTPASPPSLSRCTKKKRALKERSRAKRVAEAVQRVSECGSKPHVLTVAQGAESLAVKDFDLHTLPVSSTGWCANPKHKLSPGLQRVWKNLEVLTSVHGLKLLEWDGRSFVRSPATLLDKNDRIVTVLGGRPPGSAHNDWHSVAADAAEAMAHCRKQSTFSNHQLHGRRGEFASRTVGFGYGNGRTKPQNFKVAGKANQAAVQELLSRKSIHRIAGCYEA
ncbi:hypothetical protein EV361DRAFT_979020 [Lentinula raphanica]|nr:hypothetical protein EV361DRAFT_979020 [Lentinula raphanica]